MKSRRVARVFSLQTLYAMEVGKLSLPEVIRGVIESLNPDDEQRKYGIKIIEKVIEVKIDLDTELESLLENWDLSRVAVIDRILLHIGMVELKFFSQIPPKVAISEAMAIGKKYSTEDTPVFINGILHKVASSQGSL